MDKSEIDEKIDALAEKLDADLLVYCGAIYPEGYDLLVREFQDRKRRKNVLLILSTYGGDLIASKNFSHFPGTPA